MYFDSSSVAGRATTVASVTRFAELVKKIGTSATSVCRKRKNNARKKLARAIKEQKRCAKRAGLRALALTLTYLDSGDFAQKHISGFVDTLRKSLKRAGYELSYSWVLECARNLHYHLIIWLPRTYRLDDTRLAKWWPWGSTWRESCQSVKAWSKYMSKFDSIAKLPKRARIWGCGGLDSEGKTAVSRAGLPQWLQRILPRDHRARRLAGEGWVDLVTGQLHRSPFIWTPWGAMLATASPRACQPVV